MQIGNNVEESGCGYLLFELLRTEAAVPIHCWNY
jgi:hypothetical protein